MWAQSGVATAREGVEDITLIIMTHPMSFPCLSSPNRKSHVRKSPAFSEGVRAVSVNFSNLGQMVKQLDSVGVDLGCVEPDLSVREVKIQKNSKP